MAGDCRTINSLHAAPSDSDGNHELRRETAVLLGSGWPGGAWAMLTGPALAAPASD